MYVQRARMASGAQPRQVQHLSKGQNDDGDEDVHGAGHEERPAPRLELRRGAADALEEVGHDLQHRRRCQWASGSALEAGTDPRTAAVCVRQAGWLKSA